MTCQYSILAPFQVFDKIFIVGYHTYSFYLYLPQALTNTSPTLFSLQPAANGRR